MAVECVLELDYESEAVADAVHRALAPDNASFVKAEARGATVIAEIRAETPKKLLHTVEDYLACVAVAEKAVRAAKG
jgi:tRNA threonylcarbamoyladenosine modification (KEOPS) complex  Pcc1 subunit